MMSDSRAFNGWQRLGADVMRKVSNDDPAGLLQVRKVLDQLERDYAAAMAALAGEQCSPNGCEHVHYSHGEIARELGVTRQAVSKRIAGVAR